MIIYKNHTEVSVANLVINLATTKYFFALKKGSFLVTIYQFFYKITNSHCNDSSETSGNELHSLQFQANEDLFDQFTSLLKIISIQSDRRYCFF
jgi:hypothetical protein